MRAAKCLVVCVLFVGILAACTGNSAYRRYRADFFDVFDTFSFIMGYARSQEEFDYFSQEMRAELQRLHRLFDIFYEYEGLNNLRTINNNAGLAPVTVDPVIIDMLQLSVEAYRISSGIVNIAIGPVTGIWRKAREEGFIPCMEDLLAAGNYIDINGLIINEDMGTVFLQHEGMSLDAGAIAKGFAIELVAQAAIAAGFESFLLSVGGDVRVAARPPGGNWSIGVSNPMGGGLLDIVYVENTSVFSSGDYLRYFEIDGQRFHHIIDPRTLMPAINHRSATVVYPDGGMADILSLAAFILDINDAREFVAGLDAEAIWMLQDGTVVSSVGRDYEVEVIETGATKPVSTPGPTLEPAPALTWREAYAALLATIIFLVFLPITIRATVGLLARLQESTMKNKLKLFFVLTAVLFVAACNNDSTHSAGSSAEYETEEVVTAELETDDETAIESESNFTDADFYEEFITTIRIHPDMPEFTVTRIVGEYMSYETSEDGLFPEPRDVRIIISDENGVIIQEINNLTQSNRSVSGGLSFDDYNFDGYLDMRLLRWQDSAGGLLAQEYFWLWDASSMQFVIHEQLTAIGHAAWLGADQESRRIYVGNRYRGGHALLWYEYNDGWFSVVHRAFTRPFDAPTDERLVVTMNARLLPYTVHSGNEYEVDITIETTGAEREVLQEIWGVSSSYSDPPFFSWQAGTCSFNPLNFDIVYLAGGNVIMSLRLAHGGSMRNDPHYFWLWDTGGRRFVEHMSLRDLSDFATVSFGHNSWLGTGNVHAVTRISQGQYFWGSYDFIDGELVPLQTRERVMDVDGENWCIKYIINDIVNDTTRIEFEACEDDTDY